MRATQHRLYDVCEPNRVSDISEKEYVEQLRKGICEYQVNKFVNHAKVWILFPDHEDNGYRETVKALRTKKK